MPIDPYDPPQFLIRQELEIAPALGVPRMATCVIGPRYLLSRYGRELTPGVAHAAGGQLVPFDFLDANGVTTDLPAGHTVDLDSVAVYAEGLRVQLASWAASDLTLALPDVSKPNILQIVDGLAFTTAFGTDANELAVVGHTFANGDYVRLLSTGTLPAPLSGNLRYYVVNTGSGVLELSLTKGGTPITLATNGTGTHHIALASGSSAFSGSGLHDAFEGRNTLVGDYVRINDGTTIRTRQVAALLGSVVQASYGTNTDRNNSTGANGDYNPVTDATADTAVDLAKPSGFTATIVQTSLNLNIRGSSISSDRKVSEEFTITVTQGGAAGPDNDDATFSITSKSGVYSATGVKATDDSGYLIDDAELAGATYKITGGTVATGQVFKFRVYQGYTRLSSEFVFSGTYTGPKDTTYIVEVTKGSVGDTAAGAECRIYDTEGIDIVREDVVIAEDTVTSVGTYGLGVLFNIAPTGVTQKGLRKGDIYYVHAKAEAASTTTFDRILLDGPVVNSATFLNAGLPLAGTFNLLFTGRILPTDAQVSTAWTADATGVTISSALSRNIPTRTGDPWVAYEDAVGEVHLSWRAVKPTALNEGLTAVATVDQNVTLNGPATPDNTLAFGVGEALRGADGQRVYFLATAGTAPADYTAALRKIEATDIVWALTVLSTDEDVATLVSQHVQAMSAPDRKMFRKVYIGVDSPGQYVLLDRQADTSPYLATITDNGGVNTLLTLTAPADNVDFDSITITPGDSIRLTSNGAEYVIARKISATELELVTGPLVAVSPASPFTIWAADTPANVVRYMRARVNALDHRRTTLVWYEDGMRSLAGTPTVIPAMFTAAEIAGIRSSLPPQVGLSMHDVTAITSAPAMFNRYSTEELNAIAAEGVMIVTQNVESGAVYIRHQLTTEGDNGILYQEDNISMIVDYVSFRFKDEFGDVIGRVNVTDNTIANLYARAGIVLDSLKQSPVGSPYGSTIVDYNNLSVARDPLMRDRINISVNISVPVALNTLDITLRTFVDLPAITTNVPTQVPQA